MAGFESAMAKLYAPGCVTANVTPPSPCAAFVNNSCERFCLHVRVEARLICVSEEAVGSHRLGPPPSPAPNGVNPANAVLVMRYVISKYVRNPVTLRIIFNCFL